MVARNDHEARSVPLEKPIAQPHDEIESDLVLRVHNRLVVGLAEADPLNDIAADHDCVRQPERRLFRRRPLEIGNEAGQQLVIADRVGR